MSKSNIKKAILLITSSFALAFIGILIALLISSKYYNMSLSDIIFIEGVLLVILGVIPMMQQGPLGVNVTDVGQPDSQHSTHISLEVTQMEAKPANYNKNLKHLIANMALSSMTVTVSGVLLIIYCMI